MDAVDRLLDMNAGQFASVVDKELRGKATPDESTALRSPQVAERWHGTLLAMMKSVDGQLGARRADFMSNRARFTKQLLAAEYEERFQLERSWAEQREMFNRSRASTLRFKSGLEETIIEARALVDEIKQASPSVRLWRFEHAPEDLRRLSQNGDDGDWLALIPATCVRGVDTFEDVDGVVRTNVQYAGGYLALEELVDMLDVDRTPEYHLLNNGNVVAIGSHA